MNVTSVSVIKGEYVEFDCAEHETYVRYSSTDWAKIMGESTEPIFFKSEYEPLEKSYNEYKSNKIVVLPPTIVPIRNLTYCLGGMNVNIIIVFCAKTSEPIALQGCMGCEFHMCKEGVDYIFDSEKDLIEAMEGNSKYFGAPDLRARMLRLIPDKFKIKKVET